MGREAWLPWAKAPPSASRGCSCAAPLVLAACCTPARVCISLSFVLAARCPIVCTHLSRRPSAALTALQELLYQSLHALVAFESVIPEQLQPCRLPVPSPLSCPCAAVRAGGLPAASSAGQPLARGVRAAPRRGHQRAGWQQGGMGWADAVGGKGRCRVGREVAHPDPSPDPDKEISTIRLFR